MSHFLLQENTDGSVNLIRKTQVLAEICGKVTYINPKNRKLFAIHAEKMNKTFRCFLSYDNPFCPLREGDAVFGVAEYTVDPRYGDTLNLIQPPLVVIGEDKATIIKNFVDALRGTGFGSIKANLLLEALILKTGSLSGSIETLDRMASFYCFHNNIDTSILEPYIVVFEGQEKHMIQLLEWWYKNRNLRRLYLLGINNSEIRNSKLSPEELYKVCLENPYKIFSLNIDKCDDITRRMGKEIKNDMRYCGEICRKISEYMNSRGWSGIPADILVKMYPDIVTHLNILKEVFDLKMDLHTVYLPYAHEVETGITNFIKNLLDSPTLPGWVDPSEVIYTRNDITEEQKVVIQKSLTDNICIIRGGGGVGKSTIIKEIIYNLKKNGVKYRVVSFTGKAVARIREITEQKDPMTMHMAIITNNKSLVEHVVVDEASMVTSELLYEFINKFGNNFRLTLVGDPNQLEIIGYGSLFKEVIKSGIVPIYTLHQCHRNSSGILENASNIVECNEAGYDGPPFQFQESDDFNIINGSIQDVGELIKILQDSGIPNAKITVISPFNRYLDEINLMCQDIYNINNREIKDINSRVWRINDRVMMTENNYKINVMNGDEGIITDISDKNIKVTFKDNSEKIFSLNGPDPDNDNEKINNKELTTSSLVLSFCVSVHRYQGSENDFIIFFIPQSKESKFLNRNLLYTGITRAKKIIWMIGDHDTMLRAATTAPAYKHDNLAQRLINSRTINLK